MRCKPGDLAFIVKAKIIPELLGAIVEVVGPWAGPSHEKLFAWEVRFPDGRLIPTNYGDGSIKMNPSRPVHDSCLRPIRDPGDDAVDESRAWLPPVPTKELA